MIYMRPFIEELKCKIDQDYLFENKVVFANECLPLIKKGVELKKVRSPGFISWYIWQDHSWRDPHSPKNSWTEFIWKSN